MRYYRFLFAFPLLLTMVVAASADPRFYVVFKKEYLENHKDKKFVEAMDKMDVRCLVCHQGKKSKKNHNPFGLPLVEMLDRKKDLKNDKKIAESLKKALAMKVDPKNPKSETYLDRLNASKWPGGNLEDLKKEPKGSEKDGGEEKKE